MPTDPPEPTTPPAPPAREPQLDGLRCLAFLAVFGQHARDDLFPWGLAGVQTFFALSGFLITRILVRGESGRIGADLRRYYLRRTLRIFPLYYLVIALLGVTGHLGDVGTLATFTYNIRGFLQEAVDPVAYGHFWSLCVEEQFYLLFPLILLRTPARARGVLIGTLIAGSVLFQVYAHRHYNFRAARLLLPYCGADLLWGCVAGLVDLRLGPPRGRERPATAGLALGLSLLVLAWNLGSGRVPRLPAGVQAVVAVSVFGVANALIVLGASRTRSRWVLAPLALAPVAYLGRISYGLYLFHLPMLHVWRTEIPFGFLLPRVWGALGLTVLAAAVSWRFFEGPINRLKDRWSAAPGSPEGAGAAIRA